MARTTTARVLGFTGATAIVAAAAAVGMSGATQAEPEPAPPGPVTTPVMSTAETTVDLSPEATEAPTVATPPVTASTTEPG